MKKQFIFFIILLLSLSISAFCQNLQSQLSPINNPNFNEYNPSITSNGKTLVFQTDRGTNGRWEVFISYKDDKAQWTTAQPLSPINTFGKESDIIGSPSISYDGKLLFFSASYEDGFGDMDIYYAIKQGEGWSIPRNIGSSINTSQFEGLPSLSLDGKQIYFSRSLLNTPKDMPSCYAIWVSNRKEDGTWDMPKLLPYPINTGCEKSPRILSDGKTLIFSSIRNDTQGGFDLYQSTLQDNGTWSNPVNLDFVNTVADEVFASVPASGDVLYIQRNGDITTLKIPEKYCKHKSISLDGFVVDALTQQAATSPIILSSDGNQLSLPLTNGAFKTLIQIGKQYKISINQPGYMPYQKTIDLTQNTDVPKVTLPINLIPNKLPFQLHCLDKTNKKPLNKPKIKITETISQQNVATFPQEEHYSFELGINKIYDLTVTAVGYGVFSAKIKADSSDIGKLRNKWVLLSPLAVPSTTTAPPPPVAGIK
jgi:WD40-like Beta Propeller Repeat